MEETKGRNNKTKGVLMTKHERIALREPTEKQLDENRDDRVELGIPLILPL